MADRGDTHYHTPTLNLWFLVSSIALLGASVWMVLDDFNAPWKAYQRDFRVLEVERAQAELLTPELQAAAAAERVALEGLAVAERELAASGEEIAALEEELTQAKAEKFRATETAKKAKQDHSFLLFEVQEHRVHEGDDAFEAEKVEASAARLSAEEGRKELADFAVADCEARLAALRAGVKEAGAGVKTAAKDLELLRKRIEAITPASMVNRAANVVRDQIPGLDFIGPNLKVQKVVLDDLTNNLNFTLKTRIDMCHTCHIAVDREGYDEGVEEPFRSHPNLDLYLSAKSPHPLSDVGCTICHRGAGEALDFIRVDHRPVEDELEEWREEHHWHKQHHWDWPMLTKEYTEAGCVQCHQTSMELIAEDAPHVSEGYRLFERYGCYACHKVEWFPTKRRPGPSLVNMQAKLKPDFIASWVAAPRSFRPMTWMPQIFHLENFAAEEVVVTSEWGAGRDILGAEWSDTAVASIVAFLTDRTELREQAPIPVAGDAERGREVFRISGCLGCHNLAPYEGDEPQTNDPAFDPKGGNEHGPNLRGVATKINAPWLYNWVKDPHAYWDQTRMPDLRLSDQDAADVTAYVMDDPEGVFHDVPAGWAPAEATFEPEVLREQARRFFGREGRRELARRFAGENPEFSWDDPDQLLIAVGEKFVLSQGCYSCHEIPGLEDTMPIGTELTAWGSKTVDKLDWGFIPDEMAASHGWIHEEREEYKHFRENWIELKLDEPRSFDRHKVISNPLDRLRMPSFDLNPGEIKAIASFVVGLVDDEVQRAKMVPTAAQVAMDHGLRVIRQKNCAACHVLEPGTVTFRDEAGREFTVQAELAPIGEEIAPPEQSDLESLLAEIAAYEEEMDEEVEDVGFRLLEVVPEVGLSQENVFVPIDDLIAITPPRGGDLVATIVEYYMGGIEMFDEETPDDPYFYWNLGEDGEVEDVDGELRAYLDEPYDKVRSTFAPPVLIDEGYKLQRDWFYAFLIDPVSIRRQMRVRMPSFHFEQGEAEAVADYFAHDSALNWPARYTRTLRFSLGVDAKPTFHAEGKPWPELATQRAGGLGVSVEDLARRASIKPEDVRAIEAGAAPETAAKFADILALGASAGFHLNGPVVPGSGLVSRRAPSHVAGRRNEVQLGALLATDSQAVNCYNCHWHADQPPGQEGTPLAWGPDLALTRERLREQWTEDWLWSPGMIYPFTAMPGNFTGDPPQYQTVYPDSTNLEQVQAVLDWLYNFDRISEPAPN
ncbi:MAG TPA: c-type cytochrome [Planctomycetota bacterium]|nr:c-type cytochrome [Planctomycetota bacterium]